MQTLNITKQAGWVTKARIILKQLMKKCAPETVSTFGGEDHKGPYGQTWNL